MSIDPPRPRTADAISAATGLAWPAWVDWLDAHDGRSLPHARIAELAHDRMGSGSALAVENAGWWAQSVTVAYEQQIGRRVPGQRQDGTFYVSVNRTAPVAPQQAMEAWLAYVAGVEDPGGCRPAGPARTSTTPKRLYWRTACTDGSTLQLAVEPSATGSRLALTREGLPTPEAREGARQVGKEMLAALAFD